ncbi:MAG: efflux transporter outer membrane subunit [Rhodocyclales bacterium]|nr:efflux transporter outer membrane subunit [Rhodocyclales bacterium]
MPDLRRTPLALALLLASAGCSMMPDYFRPEPPVAEQWPASVDPRGERDIADMPWQEYFPDPRMQALIAAALENNRDLRVAVARVEEARAMYRIQRADRFPNVSLDASEQAARMPGDLSPSGRSSTDQRYDVGLGLLSFELDFWGRVASLTEAARQQYLATEEAQRAFRLSLISDVANAYLSLKEAEESLLLAKETLRTRAEMLTLVEARRNLGVASELDYLQARGSYETARVAVEQLDQQRVAAENYLRLVVGIDRSDWPEGRSLRDQDLIGNFAVNVPSEVLLRRPDVRAAERQLIAANANIGAARAAFFPRITLTGMLGTASAAFSGLFDAGSAAWTFQPMLTQPIFDAGRTQANLDLAVVRKNIAVAQYESIIQQAFREVADLLSARERIARQLEAQMMLERTQQQRLALTEARYREGITSFLEVLDAQRDAFAASQAVISTRRQLLSAAAQLYKALGGSREFEGEPIVASANAPDSTAAKQTAGSE